MAWQVSCLSYISDDMLLGNIIPHIPVIKWFYLEYGMGIITDWQSSILQQEISLFSAACRRKHLNWEWQKTRLHNRQILSFYCCVWSLRFIRWRDRIFLKTPTYDMGPLSYHYTRAVMMIAVPWLFVIHSSNLFSCYFLW